MPSGMTDSAADLPVGTPGGLQALIDFRMAGSAGRRIDCAAEFDRQRPMRRMAVAALPSLPCIGMRQVTLAAGESLGMLFVAGGAGKLGVQAWGGGEFLANLRVAVEAGPGCLRRQSELERPMGVSMADQTRAAPFHMAAPLVTVAAGTDHLQVAGGVSRVAIQAADRRSMRAAALPQVGDLPRVAFRAVRRHQRGCGRLRGCSGWQTGTQQQGTDEADQQEPFCVSHPFRSLRMKTAAD